MTQHVTYKGSSNYTLHKVTGPYSGHCTAYYDADGKLFDAEQFTGNWTRSIRSVKVDGPIWKHLQAIGVRYKSKEQYNAAAITAIGIAVGRNRD